MNLLFLCAAVAAIAGFCWAVAKFTDDTATVEPATRATFDQCNTTACPYAAWIPVTLKSGRVVEVCAGCHAEGYVRGWWAA